MKGSKAGKLYKPWNDALRGMAATNKDPLKKEKLLQWATCIAVLYEAVIILSTKTKPTTVFRGLDESWLVLPEEFFSPEKSKSGFAGGVELAFMSTTEDKQVECTCKIQRSRISQLALLSLCCRLRLTFQAALGRKHLGKIASQFQEIHPLVL